jgi:hypothetical protein
MATRTVLAALVAAFLVGPSAGLAQTKKPDCPQPSASPRAQAAPQKIEGVITQVDRKTNMVTLRMPDGTTQQFTGDEETIADLEVGDRIEAQKRTPDC